MTLWKWDADQRDPLTVRRVPVTPPWPVHGYFAAFDKESPRRPTEAEVRQIQSFIAEARQDWEVAIRGAELENDPFDWFPGYNTVVLHKYATGDWAYRRKNWVAKPHLYPASPRGRRPSKQPMTLVQIMDYIRVDPGIDGISPDWLKWKAERPEVFGQE
jgi:hypothetical protein